MFLVGKKFMLLFHPWRKFGIRLRKLGKRGKGEDNQNPNESLPRNERITEQPESRFVASVREQPAVAYFSTYGTCGILDTGASKSVIGSKLLPALT